MLHLWVIALFIALVLRESLDAPLMGDWLTARQTGAVTLGSMALLGLVTHVIVALSTRRLRSAGSWRSVLVAEAALACARWCAVLIHLAAILVLGWLDAVRSVLGDLVLLDELVTITPPLLVFAWGWWALWPMERALRAAVTMRRLDEGVAIYPVPGRARFVMLNMRHHVLVWLAPLALVLSWTEGARLLVAHLSARGGAFTFLADADNRALSTVALEFLGVVLIFLVLGPLAMRLVWDTARLEPGPLRDRLLALCRRHRVRISEVLVWRTHGTMINGAVLGLTPAFRYVLLTDALLDSLPDDQVEAVMAHEVAHVRHRHIVWLALVLVVSVSGGAWLAELALRAAGVRLDAPNLPEGIELGIAGAAFALAMLVFGVVSRRFEWQADAFAAAHMSEHLRMLGAPDEAPGEAITHDGAAAMAEALRAVARLNHIPLERPSWRHGSIGARLRRLADLIGTPSRRLPINATARTIKLLSLALFLGLLGLGLVQFLLAGA